MADAHPSGRDERAWQTRAIAIIMIGLVLAWALYLGHNGVLLAGGIGAIAYIAGERVGIIRGRNGK